MAGHCPPAYVFMVEKCKHCPNAKQEPLSHKVLSWAWKGDRMLAQEKIWSPLNHLFYDLFCNHELEAYLRETPISRIETAYLARLSFPLVGGNAVNNIKT